MQIHRIRTPKPPIRPKREKGNVGFPTGTLTLGPPEPPSGPPDLYANLLGFGTPGPQKPRVLPSGSKSILPAASGRPPGDPRRLLEAPRAPPPARGAIRPRKHGTSASQGGRKHVFYGPRANPGRNRTEKTRHFARPGRKGTPKYHVNIGACHRRQPYRTQTEHLEKKSSTASRHLAGSMPESSIVLSFSRCPVQTLVFLSFLNPLQGGGTARPFIW